MDNPVDGVPDGFGAAVADSAGDIDRDVTGNTTGDAAAAMNGRASSPTTQLGPDMRLSHHLSSRRHMVDRGRSSL
ncbi:MAG TPA: hypothetical protein VIS06_02265 [Mycobacteriales bacterium]